MASQGAFSAYIGAPPESIRPQEGVGSAVPSPRKLSEASVRMALPSWGVKTIKKGTLNLAQYGATSPAYAGCPQHALLQRRHVPWQPAHWRARCGQCGGSW